MYGKTKVSILMPVYNVESYVARSIRSILSQDFSDFEFIIVNDGSNDRTGKICERYSLKDSRIKYYDLGVNTGIVFALNFGLSKAKGDFILRMDGDDVSSTSRLRKKVEYLEKFPDVDVVGCSVISIDKDGNELGRTKYPEHHNDLVRMAKYTTPIPHIWLARKKVYDVLIGYREIKAVEDYDFLLRAVSSGFRLANVPGFYGYGVLLERSGNTASSMSYLKLKHKWVVYKYFLSRLNEGQDEFPKGLEKSVRNNIRSILFERANCNLLKAIKHRSDGTSLYFWYLVQATFSIDLLRYLYERFILKLLMRKC